MRCIEPTIKICFGALILLNVTSIKKWEQLIQNRRKIGV
jgi:hypothetical protein